MYIYIYVCMYTCPETSQYPQGRINPKNLKGLRCQISAQLPQWKIASVRLAIIHAQKFLQIIARSQVGEAQKKCDHFGHWKVTCTNLVQERLVEHLWHKRRELEPKVGRSKKLKTNAISSLIL